MPDFYRENFIDYCENNEVREIAVTDEAGHEIENIQKDKICFIVLESEEKTVLLFLSFLITI